MSPNNPNTDTLIHDRSLREQPPRDQPLRFPIEVVSRSAAEPHHVCPPSRSTDHGSLPETVQDIFSAMDDVSRRIDDLARALNCLGHFDDPDNGPRAA